MTSMLASARGKASTGWSGHTCSCRYCRGYGREVKLIRRLVKHRERQRWRRDLTDG